MRALRKLGLLLGCILAVLGAFLLSVTLHLRTESARDLVRREASSIVNAEIRGEIGVAHVPILTPRRVVLRDVTVRDAEGREVVRLEEVEVRPNLGALLRGTIGFRKIAVRGGEVRLLTGADGELSLIGAFEPRRPAEEGTEGEPTRIAIESLEVDGLDVTLPDVPFDIADLHLRASLYIEESVAGSIAELTADVVRGEQRAHFTLTRGSFALGPGERSTAAWTIATGGDRLRGRMNLRMPDERAGRPIELAAQLRLEPLSNATLRFAGLDGFRLAGPVRGRIVARGSPENATAQARLRTRGGPIRLDASLRDSDHVQLAISTPGISLDGIVADGPSLRVGGAIEARVGSILRSPRTLRVEARDLRVDEHELPSLVVSARIEDEAVVVHELRAPFIDGNFSARGRVGFDGSAHVHLHASDVRLGQEPTLRRVAPHLRGRLSTEVQVRLSGGDDARLSLGGELALTDFAYRDVAMRSFRIAGTATGEVLRPIVDARVEARDVRVEEIAIDRTSLDVRGGPSRYRVRADLSAPGRRAFGMRGQVVRTADGVRADVAHLAVGVGDRTWRGRIKEVRFLPGDRVELTNAVLAHERERLSLAGRYKLDGELEFTATLQQLGLDIAKIVPGVDTLPAEGFVDLFVDARGSVDRPHLVVQGALYEGSITGVPIHLAALYGEYDGETGRLASDVDVELGGQYGTFAVGLEGQIDPRMRDRARALREGTYEVELEATDVSARLLEVRSPDDATTYSGFVSGRARASGTIRDPRLWLAVQARNLGGGGVGPFTFALESSYEDESFQTYAAVGDAEGLIAITEIDAEVDLPRLADEPSRALDILRSRRVQFMLDVPPRRLDTLPPPLWQGGTMPALASLSLTLDHAPDRPMRADFTTELDWARVPEASPLSALGACDEAAAGPSLFLSARLRDDEVTMRAYGTLDRRRILQGEARMPIDVDDLLDRRAPPALPPVDATLRLAGLSLDRVPGICEFASGPIEAALDARDLFTASPRVRLEVRSPALRTPQAEPVRLAIEGELTERVARGSARLEGEEGSRLRATANVPLHWTKGEPLPRMSDARIVEADLQFDEMPLGPLLAPVPDVGFAGGVANGRMRLRGTLDEPRLSGAIALWDATVSILSTGQRFDGIRGRVIFDGRRARLSNFQARDGGGRLEAEGTVTFEQLRPREASLTVRSRNFPVRQAGVVVATVTANSNVTAVLTEERAEGRVELDGVRVGLRDITPPRLQDLETHPEVVVLGQRGPESDEPAEEPGRPAILHLVSTRDFWVRRQDLSAQMDVDITASFEDEVRLTGRVRLYRGFFELAGRRFELQEGELQFTGGDEIDPVVRVVATNEISPGESLTITITGRAQSPQLAFVGPRGEPLTAGEAVGRMMGRQRAQPTGGLENQAATVLSSLTAGVLTTTLRRELGDLAPVIVIEPGAAPGATRLRAGISADRAIPKFLRSVVRGAYVEGFASTPGAPVQGTGVPQYGDRAGFLIELLFPRDLVTTFQYAPPNNWGADFLWQP